MRFSLKTLIIAVLLVCLGLSLWTVSQQLRTVTSELRSHRNELGHLSVTDATKINFISVPQHEDMKWRWRVRLPSGRKYNLCFNTINIAEEGFPEPSCTFFLDGGDEFTVTVVCHRDPRDDWNVTAMTTSGHSQDLGFLGPTHLSWFEGRSTCRYSVNGKGQTTSVDPHGPADLLRLRIKDSNDVPTDDGILVWIAEATDRS